MLHYNKSQTYFESYQICDYDYDFQLIGTRGIFKAANTAGFQFFYI